MAILNLHKHHHLSAAIALVPLMMLLFAALFGEFQIGNVVQSYEERKNNVIEELLITDVRLRNAQKAYGALHGNQTPIMSPVTEDPILTANFGSAYEGYEALKNKLEYLRERLNVLLPTVHAYGEKAIIIDLSDQKMTTIDDGAITGTFPVSSGAYETPTPRGEFKIHHKQELRVSSQDVPYRMPYYMAFTENQSHGLHALPYLGNKATNSDFWHEARNHIGIPVSHGCVRLLPEDAEKLYEWVEVGTAVLIRS